MSCSPFDLRDYLLRELAESECREVDTHLRDCEGCREDLERLRLMEAALLTVREEEIPQRIAFVSDKVFEPSPWRRWLRNFWNSSARLAFASAAMLSVAIVFQAVTRPAQVLPAPAQHVDMAKLEKGFSSRMNQAVQQAVAESEKREAQRTARLLAAVEARHSMELKAIQVAVEENLSVMQKHLNRMVIASNEFGAVR